MGIDVNRERAIDLAVSQIEKQFGKGAIMKLGEDALAHPDIQVLPTGSLGLDLALGVGGDIQSDLLLQRAGDVVGTAVRTRARTELQKKFTAEYADYTLEQGLVDIRRYGRETCNLNVGLNEIRALLNIIGPIAPQPQQSDCAAAPTDDRNRCRASRKCDDRSSGNHL